MTDLGVTVTDSLDPGSTFGEPNAWLRRPLPPWRSARANRRQPGLRTRPYLDTGPVVGKSKLHEYACLPGIGNVSTCRA